MEMGKGHFTTWAEEPIRFASELLPTIVGLRIAPSVPNHSHPHTNVLHCMLNHPFIDASFLPLKYLGKVINTFCLYSLISHSVFTPKLSSITTTPLQGHQKSPAVKSSGHLSVILSNFSATFDMPPHSLPQKTSIFLHVLYYCGIPPFCHHGFKYELHWKKDLKDITLKCRVWILFEF